MPELAVLKEKVLHLEREVRDLKNETKLNGNDIDILERQQDTILYKLEQIQITMGSIQKTVSSDSGWRGFFLDFIKAAAQIAVLVGAGKWIF
jgi:CII-binding regulator of phage lambda lysogenization HflD